MMNVEKENKSPPWGSTLKLITGLTTVGIAIGLIIQYRSLLGPLILTFVISYLLYPVAKWISKKLKISWKFSVNLIFLLMVITIVGLIVWGGIAIVEQGQALISLLQNSVNELPIILEQISSYEFAIGPFLLDFRNLDLPEIGNQLISVLQPILSQTGSIIGGFASSAFVTLGWLLFIILISYFVLAEMKDTREKILRIRIPDFQKDYERILNELRLIWNAFLRGQVIITIITILIYMPLLAVLGIRYSFELAFLAALARFVPYLGPAVTWIVYGSVALFQGSTLFGLDPWIYAIIVVGISWFVDTIIDNFIV
ncbi:MAG: AI-2E family transporter [Anaerolineaceae bacterium]|nr:AI-2E family transporter [Anaerolineaceae bacterium]